MYVHTHNIVGGSLGLEISHILTIMEATQKILLWCVCGLCIKVLRNGGDGSYYLNLICINFNSLMLQMKSWR